MPNGAIDRRRLIVVERLEGSIADRMGRSASGSADDMPGQAHTLFSLYRTSDLDYLDRRIREETADDYGLADLQH